jgi:hypothetical protein
MTVALAEALRPGGVDWADVRTEGAGLESEADKPHRATPQYVNAHAISDLTVQNDYPVFVRKPRCSSAF